MMAHSVPVCLKLVDGGWERVDVCKYCGLTQHNTVLTPLIVVSLEGEVELHIERIERF